MTVHELALGSWILLALGAFFVGIAKTSINGLGTLAVVAFVVAVPAKESTGALLPLLIVGDIIAVRVYHRHADWRVLARLLPSVLPGLVLGAWFLTVADDTLVRRSIGAIILLLCGLQIWRSRLDLGPAQHTGPAAQAAAVSTGAAAGFVTMTANAAGPVTNLYFLRVGMPMMQMLGTVSWFYFVVNLIKVPFSASASLITGPSLLVDAMLLPALALGAVVGIAAIKRIDQKLFERLLLWLSIVSGALLLF